MIQKKEGIILLTGIILVFLGMVIVIDFKNKENDFDSIENNISTKNNTIDIDSLTTKQKLAQMIIVRGDKFEKDFLDLSVGGIFLDNQNSLNNYTRLINKYQKNSNIKLFVATDFEGAWSPFSKTNLSKKDFPKFSDIKTPKEAYKIGLKQGELLKELGFNINFAPVAEFDDKAYGGRVFTGTKENVRKKLKNYIKGLQKNVLGTCKHYPGKGMIKNTHFRPDKQNITKKDLELFEICFKNNVSSVMIGHQKVYGEISSDGKPSTVSKKVIESVPDENVLIITDEINMWGLKFYYIFQKKQLYRDLINSGNNIILDFKITPSELNKLSNKLEKDVEKGLIDENKLDKSVIKILNKKSYEVVS